MHYINTIFFLTNMIFFIFRWDNWILSLQNPNDHQTLFISTHARFDITFSFIYDMMTHDHTFIFDDLV